MQLFTKSSSKSKLQRALDEERSCEKAGCAVKEGAVESTDEQKTTLFGTSEKQEVFQVDLLGDWLKP